MYLNMNHYKCIALTYLTFLPIGAGCSSFVQRLFFSQIVKEKLMVKMGSVLSVPFKLTFYYFLSNETIA